MLKWFKKTVITFMNEFSSNKKEEYDYISPDHYKSEGRKECWDEMEEVLGSEAVYWWCLCNIYKYIYRMGVKPNEPKERDMNKIVAYMGKANELMTKTDIHLCDLDKFMDIVRKEVNVDVQREEK